MVSYIIFLSNKKHNKLHMAKERKPKTKVIKGNDPRMPSYSRFKDVYIPTQKDKIIRPESIFDGFKKKDTKKLRNGKKY
tara:strand:- start:43 stop:279 length:237 start_codon:yes stop_codon:yes gene_type:complete